MSYYVIVYTMDDGSEVPDDLVVEIPDDLDEDDIESYVDEHYPQIGEYQVEPND